MAQALRVQLQLPCQSPRGMLLLVCLAVSSVVIRGGLSQTTSASTTSTAPPATIFTLADCPNPISSTTDCDCSQCALYGTVYLKDKCCSQKGVPATILAFEQSDSWVPRINEFNACTGARLSLTYNGPDGKVG